ncbi:single-stranded DNA-binding protein [Candidatus Babeliales bacterium]|nr:single-stranded DNA-binding protein [Candidatus Babeliales bacterium]
MAGGYNRIIMVGNLTRDPELKQLPSGQAVCRLNVASNRQFRNRQSGDMVQEVCFVDVDVWGPQAESSKQYLEKGRQVLIEGRLKLDNWQDTEGKSRSKHSIVADRVVFLSSSQSESGATFEKRDEDDNSPMEPRNDVERELLSQLDQIKAKTTPSSSAFASAPKAVNPAVFKDEAPFTDDLPF